MTWSWRGFLKRALEFADGVLQPEPAPLTRARLRYNATLRRMEQSIELGAYAQLQALGDPSALNQDTWFIDPITGDDSHDGLTAATALATWEEYDRRVGIGVATVEHTVNILSDLTESEFYVRARYPLGLEVMGQRTLLYSGTTSGAVAWDITTTPVTDGTLTDASLPGTWSDSGPGGSSLVGKMIVMTSGPNAGKTAWVLADLGAKTARISQLYDAATFTTGAPGIGDTFDVVDLTKMTGTSLGSVVIENLGEQGFGNVFFQNVEMVGLLGGLTAQYGFIEMFDCKVSQSVATTVFPLSTPVAFSGCLFAGTGIIAADTELHNYLNSSFIDAKLRSEGAKVSFFFVNPHQKAGGAQAAGAFITVANGGSINLSPTAVSAVGVVGQTGTGTAVVATEPGGTIIATTGNVVFSIGQTVGAGAKIDSYSSAHWPAGGSAPSFYKFDVSGPAIEFDLGGVTTTAAALGAAGAITAANNAGAVPQT